MPPPFASSEHASFEFISTSELGSESYQFTLSNGVQLLFGDIVALAGDYYAVTDKPICLGQTPDERAQRFLAAFHTLDTGNAADVNKLIEMIKGERKAVDKAIAEGHPEDQALSCHALQETIDSITFTKDKYLALADNNLDHFGEDALSAFQTGHQLAMQAALEASQIEIEAARIKKLEYAFKLEAFACHFLTDQFAAGHIRTPRKALYNQIGVHIGSLLSLFQHDEDGKQGLTVKNDKQVSWKSYGDGHYFTDVSKDNQAHAIEAVKVASQEVYNVFKEKRIPDAATLDIFRLIPKVGDDNFPALFFVNPQNKILYRSKLGDIQCREYKELTHEAVVDILAHYSKQYAEDDSMMQKIENAKKVIEADVNKIVQASLKLFTPAKKPAPPAPIEEPESTYCQCSLL
jgi:hypothetical protein